MQGTAGTTEDHLRYSWNYALLLAEGPTERSLVRSPVYQAMEAGRIVRAQRQTGGTVYVTHNARYGAPETTSFRMVFVTGRSS